MAPVAGGDELSQNQRNLLHLNQTPLKISEMRLGDLAYF